MKTALEAAKQYFQLAVDRGRTRLSNIELHGYVCNVTGQSRDVVHGTLDSVGAGSLYSAAWYKANWRKEINSNGRVIHCCNRIVPESVDYSTPMKQAALERIIQFLPQNRKITVVTTALNADIFHRAVLRHNPLARLDKVKTIDDIKNHYEFAHIDTGGGYISKLLHGALTSLNNRQGAQTVALTVACLNKFRNSGRFQKTLREQYAGCPDQHAQCIADCLDKYEMVDRFVYSRNLHSTRSEVFIFKLSKKI